MIDRLERSGLVVRDASRDDLRAREVRLTASGRKLVQQLMGVHAAQIDLALGGLSLGDQQELHRLLERLSGHLEGMLEPSSRAAKTGGDSENKP
jgi:DNA-binding MarR family transcriptional regulator